MDCLERLDLANAHSEILTPGATDTLKLSFTVIDDESVNEGVQPHQAFLRFWIEGGVEGIQPVKVSPNGKAKFELVCFDVLDGTVTRIKFFVYRTFAARHQGYLPLLVELS